MAVDEPLDDGWEPECIAETLVEFADDYMDTVISDIAIQAPSRRTY